MYVNNTEKQDWHLLDAWVALRKYHIENDLKTVIYFLTVQDDGNLRSRTQQCWFLPRPVSLTCRWPPAQCTFLWPFLCMYSPDISFSSYGNTSIMHYTLMMSLYLNSLFNGLIYKLVISGVRDSTYKFWGNIVWCIITYFKDMDQKKIIINWES